MSDRILSKLGEAKDLGGGLPEQILEQARRYPEKFAEVKSQIDSMMSDIHQRL